MRKNRFILIVLIFILAFSMASCANSDNEGGTNTQESTIDEGDIVKIGNDGLIYNCQSDGITVTQTDNGMMNVIASYSKKRYVPKEMYINGNYLITIGGIGTEFYSDSFITYNYYKSSYSQVVVNVFDMAEIKALPFGEEKVLLDDYIIYSFSLNGEYYTSRLYSETKELYLIFNYRNYIEVTVKEGKRENEYNATDIIYTENGEDKQLSDIEEIKDLAAEHYSLDAVLFLKVNLTDENIAGTAKGYYGAKFQDLYMSESALYPIFFMHDYNKKSGACYRQYTPHTYMLKVSRTDLQAEEQIKLTGCTVYDRYAVKDFGDYIYVCATNQFDGSVVFAYDGDLSEVGKLEKIAPGEEIKSVTYQTGDDVRYCYITTFRQTDPLFKIDITNPSEIKLLSALSMPGYATYLHTLSDEYMIGIGYDGDENNADISKIRVSLYDVTDDETRLVNYITISCVAYCEALSDEKAIAIDNENMVFGFSILRETGVYGFTQGYYVFNVQDGELNDLVYVTNFNTTFDDSEVYYDIFRNCISRAFVYDGYAYFIADSSISSYNVLSLMEGDHTLISKISTIIE